MRLRFLWPVVAWLMGATFTAQAQAPAPAQPAAYPAPKEAQWTLRDFKFHTGQVLPELKMNYLTIGDPKGEPVLVLHGADDPFVPPPEVRTLRNLTRYRLQLMGDRTRDAGRLEKLLEDASIKLSVVASNITGTSARDMLGALVAGERDPAVMADLARSTVRRKIPDLREALTGRFDDHHALLVGQLLQRLEQNIKHQRAPAAGAPNAASASAAFAIRDPADPLMSTTSPPCTAPANTCANSSAVAA